MKVTPKKGFILVSNQDIVKEKKAGTIIMVNEEKNRTYLRVESDGEFYKTGECVLAHPFKAKLQVEDNLFIIPEEDVIAILEMVSN